MIKNLLDNEESQLLERRSETGERIEAEKTLEIPPETDAKQTSANSFEAADSETVFNFNLVEAPPQKSDKPLFESVSKPETVAETARKSGLAYAAGITLFGSIVFLMTLGWFADLLLGTSPWGIVVGIVLGSIIGFFQFFRITSQILKNKD